MRATYVALFASVLLGLVQIPLHEGAHVLACHALGGDGCHLFSNFGGGRVDAGLLRAIHVGVGPLAGLGLALVGARLVGVRDEAAQAAALGIVIVAVGRPLLLFAVYLATVRAPRRAEFDEIVVAKELGMWPWTVIAASLAVICYCYAIVWRHNRKDLRWRLLSVAIAGVALGTFAWLRWLGPVLLPWKIG
jgi:cytochrome bd-type quinol oxidase subunit 2